MHKRGTFFGPVDSRQQDLSVKEMSKLQTVKLNIAGRGQTFRHLESDKERDKVTGHVM